MKRSVVGAAIALGQMPGTVWREMDLEELTLVFEVQNGTAGRVEKPDDLDRELIAELKAKPA